MFSPPLNSSDDDDNDDDGRLFGAAAAAAIAKGMEKYKEHAPMKATIQPSMGMVDLENGTGG